MDKVGTKFSVNFVIEFEDDPREDPDFDEETYVVELCDWIGDTVPLPVEAYPQVLVEMGFDDQCQTK